MNNLTNSAKNLPVSLAAVNLELIVREQARRARGPLIRWQPQPTQQAVAYDVAVDQLGYGGAAGAGKSDLLLGLAGTRHQRSLIMRRVFPSLRALVERSRDIYNADGNSHADDSFNEQLHRWRLYDAGRERLIEFGACQYEADLKKWQGQPHDLLAIDEATEWPEKFVRFLMAWNRTADAGQRCRLVLTFNPPMDDEGSWVITFFAPWLDTDYPEPAESGEVRYVIRTDDRDVFYRSLAEVPEGERAVAKTRTFVRATLADNPILAGTGYGATIDALPEPLRSLLRGNFDAARIANPWQVIPTAWVAAAQARWQPTAPGDVSAAGCDVARGGSDTTTIARLHGAWLAPLECYPGAATPDGQTVAGLLLPLLHAGVPTGIDVIGVGASAYDMARSQGLGVTAVNFAEGVPNARDKSGKLRFRNLRAAAYWALREALDPATGDAIALPPDPLLKADLCAPTWSLSAGGILIEDKESIRQRIGRSPDRADALAIAHWTSRLGSAVLWGFA